MRRNHFPRRRPEPPDGVLKGDVLGRLEAPTRSRDTRFHLDGTPSGLKKFFEKRLRQLAGANRASISMENEIGILRIRLKERPHHIGTGEVMKIGFRHSKAKTDVGTHR
jgi:hypothetical protein